MTRNVKILVVDDEIFNLDIMAYHLEEAGFAVIQAEDGETALQKLAAEADIAVVVLDRRMPRLDGLAVLERMKDNPSLKAIPVIMQTAAADFEQLSIISLEGTCGYLTKPYDGDALVSLVRTALRDFSGRSMPKACAASGI